MVHSASLNTFEGWIQEAIVQSIVIVYLGLPEGWIQEAIVQSIVIVYLGLPEVVLTSESAELLTLQ